MDHRGHETSFSFISEHGNNVYFCDYCNQLYAFEEGVKEKRGHFTESEKNNDLQ